MTSGSTDTTDAISGAADEVLDPANASLAKSGQPTPTRLTGDERARCATLYLVRHGETEWNTQDIL